MKKIGLKLRRLIQVALVSAALLLTLLLLDALYPPNLSKLNDSASVVSDVNGRPLRAFANSQGIWRYPTTNKEVSAYYLQALFNYEDRYFYQHPGVNPFAMIRAVAQAIYYGRVVSGGSTITMQVARLLHPNKRTVAGKIYQMGRALQLEWRYDKDTILDMYLNIAPFGGPIEGIAAASYVYFDKPASELTPNEAALLAVLPQSPSRFRPDRYPQRALKARNKLLSRLQTFKVWDDELIATLKQDPIYADYFPNPRLAPLLSRRLRKTHGGAQVKTFINANIQEQLEYLLKSYVHTLSAHTSGAIMVMHAQTGEVVSYLGSADFNNNKRGGHVDMINAIRSPGSTLKPFVYGAAIEQGLIHEQSLLQDVPVLKGSYRPTNFSGGFSGPVSVKEALLRSLNLPVLQVLNHSSVDALAARLNNGGLALHWPKHAKANKALILGGVGIRLEKLVSAYSSLLNQGQAVTPRFIKDSKHQQQFLLTPESAWIVQNILRQQKIPGRISEQLVNRDDGLSNNNIGWKTGTSYGYRDAWVIGYSGPYIIGVWIGRPDAKPVFNRDGSSNTGSSNALPLFLQVAAHFNQSFIPVQPNTVSQQTTCWPGGKTLAQTTPSNCMVRQQSWLVQQLAPPTLSSLQASDPKMLRVNYWREPNGERASTLCASEKATAYMQQLWPPALNAWLKPQWQRDALLPTLSDSCRDNHIEKGRLLITSIKPNSHFVRRKGDTTLTIPFAVNDNNADILWFLNGQLLNPKADNTSHKMSHDFTQAGKYQLLALDKQGRIDRVNFLVQ
ncbi:MAG: penicillin-binding protein 1C [Psychrobium sp.]|nr:penicillin-binding protein 1C [Psychrobium sp.]